MLCSFCHLVFATIPGLHRFSGKAVPMGLILRLVVLILLFSSPALAGEPPIVEYPDGAEPGYAIDQEIIDLMVPIVNAGNEPIEDLWLELDIYDPLGTKIEGTWTPDAGWQNLIFWDGQGGSVSPGGRVDFAAKYSLGMSSDYQYYFPGDFLFKYRAWKGQPGQVGAEPIGDIQEETLTILPVPAPNVDVPILMYHRVDETAPTEWWVLADEFEAQMRALVAYGYQSVSTQELYDYNFNSGTLPEKPVVLTFDDGYKNVYTYAYPVLMREGLVGEFYIVTGVTAYFATNRRYSRLIKGDAIPNSHMTWPEIMEMADNGMVIGSHSRSHLDMTTLTDSELDYEIQGSKEDLLLSGGIDVAAFCYPYGAGNGDPSIHQRLARFGYETATSAWQGISQTAVDNPLGLKRVHIYGPHPASDPESNGVSVNYDPAHPDDFFINKLDPDFPVPLIAIESVEFLDEAGDPRQNNTFYLGETIGIRVAARNDGSDSNVICSLRLDDEGGMEPLVYDSHQVIPPEDIHRYFNTTIGASELFEFTYTIPWDAPAGEYDYAVGFHDQEYVLGYALSGWIEDSFTVCAGIPSTPADITYPANDSDGAYTVSWSGVSGATSYRLERSIDDGSTWSHVYSGGSTSYSEDVGCVTADYRYRVRASNSCDDGDWRSGVHNCAVSCFQIYLQAPANDSGLSSPPTFTWTSSGGGNNRFAVDLSYDQTFSTYWSTYENMRKPINGNSWTIPQRAWNVISSGPWVYWRVRGADIDQSPPVIVPCDETRRFHKY